MIEHTVTRRVQWGETDAAGIVYYPNFYRWFDEASHALFRSLGHSMSEMMEGGHSLILLETHARFLLALHYDDQIEIASSVGELRSRTLRVDHAVLRSGRRICEGYERRVWARVQGVESPRAEPLPAGLRALIAPG